MKKWYNYPKYKADAKCRFCPHPAHWHLEIKNFGMDDQKAKWDRCSNPPSMNHCTCPGYGPEENLEFLESQIDD